MPSARADAPVLRGRRGERDNGSIPRADHGVPQAAALADETHDLPWLMRCSGWLALVAASPMIAAADPDRLAVTGDVGGSLSGHYAHYAWVGGALSWESAGAAKLGAELDVREFRYYDDECYGRSGQMLAAKATAGIDLAQTGADPISSDLHVVMMFHLGLEIAREVPVCQSRPTEYEEGYVVGLGLAVEYGRAHRFRFHIAVDQPAPFDRLPSFDWLFVNAGVGGSWGR